MCPLFVDTPRGVGGSSALCVWGGRGGVDRPVGIPTSFEEHAKLMFDLQVLAFQTDLTRVITFMPITLNSEAAS